MRDEKDLESKINELEIKSSFQDDLLNTLNDIVSRQEIEIQKLWDANRLLKRSINEVKTDNSNGDIEQPPHY